MKRMFCKFCPQGPLDICQGYLPIFLKWFILQNGKCYKVFSCLDAIFNIILYNYLNIKENNLDIYFQIALMVSQRSLWMEFATMSLLSLPQSKSVFLELSCDLIINGCGLPCHWCIVRDWASITCTFIACCWQWPACDLPCFVIFTSGFFCRYLHVYNIWLFLSLSFNSRAK